MDTIKKALALKASPWSQCSNAGYDMSTPYYPSCCQAAPATTQPPQVQPTTHAARPQTTPRRITSGAPRVTTTPRRSTVGPNVATTTDAVADTATTLKIYDCVTGSAGCVCESDGSCGRASACFYFVSLTHSLRTVFEVQRREMHQKLVRRRTAWVQVRVIDEQNNNSFTKISICPDARSLARASPIPHALLAHVYPSANVRWSRCCSSGLTLCRLAGRPWLPLHNERRVRLSRRVFVPKRSVPADWMSVGRDR